MILNSRFIRNFGIASAVTRWSLFFACGCLLVASDAFAEAGLIAATNVEANTAGNSGESFVSGTALTVGAGVLVVKPVVEVDGTHDILLGDLVEARGVSQAVIDAIRDVRLSDAPKRFESRYFTNEDLSQTLRVNLRQVMQKNGEIPRFRIPSRVVVTRRVLKVKIEDVKKAILEQLKNQCAECEFEFTTLNMPLLPKLISGDQTWSVRVRSELPRGSFTYPLELRQLAKDQASESTENPNPQADGSTPGEGKLYWVSGQVVIRRKGAVASRAANIGERLRTEDYELKLHDVTFASDSPATVAEIANSVLARAVSAGELIWRSQLRREMAIKSGDPVKVLAGSGDWEVTIDGIAQSQAYIGDLVRVKIPRTQKMISGILRDKGVVELQ